MGRVFAHLLTLIFFFLPCELAKGGRKYFSGGLLVVITIACELLKLSIDEGIHGINNNAHHSW